jgi:hypothetical protein
MNIYFFNTTPSGALERKCLMLHGLGGTGKSQAALQLIYASVYDTKAGKKRYALVLS